MKTTLNTNEIANLLRADLQAGWSYEGANSLAEYLDANLDEDLEFDRVAIRCSYSEYATASLAAEDHGWKGGEGWEDEDAKNETAFKWLEERTMVIEVCPMRSYRVIICTDF